MIDGEHGVYRYRGFDTRCQVVIKGLNVNMNVGVSSAIKERGL